ncbi:MAG: hypothetical protein JWO30_1574 [Fibrobacteres bacterium]|nr:hypothetical protein [Fibrobacterota bacterium]
MARQLHPAQVLPHEHLGEQQVQGLGKGFAQEECLVPVFAFENRIPFPGQGAAHEGPDFRIPLDQEDVAFSPGFRLDSHGSSDFRMREW